MLCLFLRFCCIFKQKYKQKLVEKSGRDGKRWIAMISGMLVLILLTKVKAHC